jgi:hypothetical protein
METSAAVRHNHSSIMVGNTVFHEMRWSAPNETPNRQITGQSLEWYNSGSQCESTVSLAAVSICGGAVLWEVAFSMSFS